MASQIHLKKIENTRPMCQWIGLLGKILTGNHRFSHEIWGFPVNLPQQTNPLNVARKLGEIRLPFLTQTQILWVKTWVFQTLGVLGKFQGDGHQCISDRPA